MTTRDRIQNRIRNAAITATPWSNDSIARRNRDQAEMLTPHIRPGDKVLDVGCGSAHLTECISDTFQAEVMGLDVKDFRVAQVPFREFDGIAIPFPDKSFDHTIVSFTLHHCHDPSALARECVRVSRNTIMVFEDLPDGRFGRLLVKMHVEAFRLQFRLKEKGGDYRSALSWLSGQALRVERKPMPYEWFDRLYVPRELLVYILRDF